MNREFWDCGKVRRGLSGVWDLCCGFVDGELCGAGD